jgi:hypothetical protein
MRCTAQACLFGEVVRTRIMPKARPVRFEFQHTFSADASSKEAWKLQRAIRGEAGAEDAGPSLQRRTNPCRGCKRMGRIAVAVEAGSGVAHALVLGWRRGSAAEAH